MAAANITLRLAQRSDLPALSQIGNAANANSALHRRISPWQDEYPSSHYHWRLNLMRERLVSPGMRIMVAEDSCSGEVLGVSCWAVEGDSEIALQKKWRAESSWSDWLEGKLVSVEKMWCRFVGMDKSLDYVFMKAFMASFQGSEKAAHPAYLSLHLIAVAPSAQGRGVGRMLIDWGKDLAAKEQLPLFLEANLEAIGFYEKGGFSRMGEDFVISPTEHETFRIPAFAWEGKQNEGRWLERDADFDGPGDRWKWKDSVLPR